MIAEPLTKLSAVNMELLLSVSYDRFETVCGTTISLEKSPVETILIFILSAIP